MTTLNEIVTKVGTAFNTAFNTVEPLRPSRDNIKIYGLAYKKFLDNGLIPVVTQGSLTDEINLLPNDSNAGFVFFEYQDPITFTPVKNGENVRYSRAKYTIDLSIIFFINFKRYLGMTKWVGDYAIYREAFKNVITMVLNTQMHKIGGSIIPNKIYDQKIEDVFRGYALDSQQKNLWQQPYYAVRFDCTLEFIQFVCS
jgi:hypothetical protein